MMGGGLYPAMDDAAGRTRWRADAAADFRPRRRPPKSRRAVAGAVRSRARADAPEGSAYPAYYRQNFHYQSGGWFTADAAARRYETQVQGAAPPGQPGRCAAAPAGLCLENRDQRGLALLDLACGRGPSCATHSPFPRLIVGLDLSVPSGGGRLASKSGGRAVWSRPRPSACCSADACSMDAVTCVYLFHELPPRCATG